MKHLLHIVLTAISIALAGLIFLISHEETVWLKWDWVKHLIALLINIENSKFTEKFITDSITYVTYVIYLMALLFLSFFSIKCKHPANTALPSDPISLNLVPT